MKKQVLKSFADLKDLSQEMHEEFDTKYRYGLKLDFINFNEKEYWQGIDESGNQFGRTTFSFVFNYDSKFTIENNILTIESRELDLFNEFNSKLLDYRLEQISKNQFSIENCQISVCPSSVSEFNNNYHHLNSKEFIDGKLTFNNKSIQTNWFLYRENYLVINKEDNIFTDSFEKSFYDTIIKIKTLDKIIYSL